MNKKEFKYFTIMQYGKEEEYLRYMHKLGWKLEKISGFRIYHFQQCEPQDIVYKIDYNQDGINNKNEYIKMFNDCGWEYIQDYVGYSYFRKVVNNENNNDIFCDDESRLQMVSRIFKGRLLPLSIFFFAVFSQLIISTYNEQPILNAIYIAILILYLIIFVWFGIEYLIFKNKLKK